MIMLILVYLISSLAPSNTSCENAMTIYDNISIVFIHFDVMFIVSLSFPLLIIIILVFKNINIKCNFCAEPIYLIQEIL